MSELPSGTVTFLFTDIEGSTNLAQKFPDALPALLARHHAILRQAIQTHNGTVFQAIGDAFCVAFHTAPDALSAALDAQRMLHAEPWDPRLCACGWAATRARRSLSAPARSCGPEGVVEDLAATTKAIQRSHAHSASCPSRMADRCCSQMPAPNWCAMPCPPIFPCAIWASTS